MSVACMDTPTGLGLCGCVVIGEPRRTEFKKYLRKLANGGGFFPTNAQSGAKTGRPRLELDMSSAGGWLSSMSRTASKNNVNYSVANTSTKVPRLTSTLSYKPTQGNASTQQASTVGNANATSSYTKPVVSQQQKQQETPVNPTGAVDTRVNPGTKPAKPYGFVNRLSDIWRMLINRIKLWWYQSKMRSGNMTDSEWKTVQTAASELGANKTARALGNWWDPDNYGAGYFDGLGNFTKQLPNIHKLRGYANVISSTEQGIPQRFKAMTDASGLIYNHGKNIQSAMDWGHKYGYINDTDYGTYNKYIGKLPKIK